MLVRSPCSNFFPRAEESLLFKSLQGGRSLKEGFEQAATGMFGYMTNLSKVDIDEASGRPFSCEGHDLHSLLFAFLDELLFLFSSEYIIVKRVTITDFDEVNFKISGKA